MSAGLHTNQRNRISTGSLCLEGMLYRSTFVNHYGTRLMDTRNQCLRRRSNGFEMPYTCLQSLLEPTLNLLIGTRSSGKVEVHPERLPTSQL